MDKLKQIQVSNLPELLSKLTGHYVTIDTIRVSKQGNISFNSNSLIEHTGIMKNTYERFELSSFNCGFTSLVQDVYWVSVNFSFTYKSGSSNGTKFTDVFYHMKTNTWSLSPLI